MASALLKLLWFGLFRKGFNSKGSINSELQTQTISIITCTHNDFIHLKKLIPALQAQSYPFIEIIIVNDRSSDFSREWLNEQTLLDHRIQVHHIETTPSDWDHKKYALMKGIQEAKGEFILLTDADCIPSHNWISTMIKYFSPETNIVIGYSPYTTDATLLNQCIQIETLYTAIQYLGLAGLNQGYMAVGRNVAYRTTWLKEKFEQLPYKHQIGGDDDLLINHVANSQEIKICVEQEAQVLSEPAQSWSAWIHQKRRHYNVGRLYKIPTQIMLGSFLGVLVLHALALSLILILSSNKLLWLWIELGFIITSFMILRPIYKKLLSHTKWPILLILGDFLYIAIISILGISTYGSKIKKWQ